ncbi:hypothetical protein LX64_04212 [Chitinophaga skermanii]|uniref:Lipoprotein n=1 Tax=Chitinophaga skermanii TaxID=331697 RepID=A0A327Q994_9BACT|nr:hypothetical protein [Chitinophaga skermanii]RAJ00505.1 hypothetical protein LX64_04212 [Chitinophaga skermanii]
MSKLLFLLLLPIITLPSCAIKRSAVKNYSFLIECPNNTSYYIINLDNEGMGVVRFCHEKSDTINYLVNKNDKMEEIASFSLQIKDKNLIDSLLTHISPFQISERHLSHDLFYYILKIDGITIREGNSSDKELNNVFRIISTNIPREIENKDYCGVFTNKS